MDMIFSYGDRSNRSVYWNKKSNNFFASKPSKRRKSRGGDAIGRPTQQETGDAASSQQARRRQEVRRGAQGVARRSLAGEEATQASRKFGKCRVEF